MPQLIIDLSPIASELELIKMKMELFANLAVKRVAGITAQRWMNMVKAAPGLAPYERAAYLDSINWDMVGNDSAIVKAEYDRANLIESGTPQFDMHEILKTSIRTKISNDGRRYLTIPMRHNTPGHSVNAPAMPPEVFTRAEKITMSSVTSTRNRVNGLASEHLRSRWLSVASSRNARGAETKNSNYVVPQNIYQWGGKLGVEPNPHHSGMVRMLGGTDKNGRQSGQYLTFRTLVEGSAGWVRPERPGLWILRDLITRTEGDINNMVRELMEELR